MVYYLGQLSADRSRIIIAGDDDYIYPAAPTNPNALAFTRARFWSTYITPPGGGDPEPPPVGGTPVATPTGPVSYATLTAALTGLGSRVPTTLQNPAATLSTGQPVYVTWDDTDTTTTLEEMFLSMLDGQVLVLRERAAPYYIDSADGFRTAGVVSVTNNGVVTPIVSTYKGRGARTWFAMTRARRGIIGLGPGVTVRPKPSAFRRPQQARPAQSTYQTADGVSHTITGAQEKFIEIDGKAANNNAMFANFKLRGDDFGQLAYHGFGAINSIALLQMDIKGAWQGFDVSPNGEAAAISVGPGSGFYTFVNVNVDGRNDNGTPVGSSALMANGCPGGYVSTVWVHDVRMGGPALYQNSGTHLWEDYTGPGWNLEANRAGFTFEANRCLLPVGQLRIGNIRSPFGSQKITARDVSVPGQTPPDKQLFSVWSSGSEPRTQLAADVKSFDGSGNPRSITIGGSLAP